jgi:hypothetical protein
LRQQAILLAGQFDDPPAFVRSLHHLLDFYSERVHRPGQAGEPPPLIAAYRSRPPVLRQIIQELAPLAKEKPAATMALCDALWEQPYLEFRLLAAALLGQTPAEPSEPILSRMVSWATKDLEQRLVDALLHQGMHSLRKENPAALLQLAETWLGEADVIYNQLGLRALLPLVNDPAFENLPVFYRVVQPLCRTTPAPLRQDLLEVLAGLARRSPVETAYFLRQSLELTNSQDTAWLIRQILREFPPATQNSLRETLRKLRLQTEEERQ